jgi:hypothetical protein
LTNTIDATGTREATIGAVNAPIDWATRTSGSDAPAIAVQTVSA